MFKNLTVGKKIVLGFTSILILVVIVAVIGFNGLYTASGGFTEYREMARDTNLSGRLQANMLMVRMNVKDFLVTSSEKDQKEYADYLKKVEEFLAEAQKEINDPERAAKIDEVETAVVEYNDAFGQVVTFMDQRNKNVNGILNVKGPFMEKTLTDIMLSAEKDKDLTASFQAGIAMKHLLLGRLYMAKFLDTNDQKAVDRVHKEFTKMQERLDILDKELENAGRREALGKVVAAKKEYTQTFGEVVQIILDRNKMITGTLDRIGPEIAKDIEDVKLDIKAVQDELGPQLMASNQRAVGIILTIGVVALISGVILMIWITRSITKPIRRVVEALTEGSEQVASASSQVSAASQSLAEGSTEQAAGLEETSSSLEEMSSMTKQNADNAQQANTLAGEARNSSESGNDAMKKMSLAIGEIQKSADETAKIIKVIDEIAFQTNLLALNAAVEAARAGEAGKGFAVVAEEVRNLAMRSAEAAKNTAAMIEESVKNSQNGVDIAGEVAKMLEEITESNRKVNDLIGEISAASQEQAQGIDQVNTAMAQMDKVTQQNAANAEESASASEELNAQAEQMNVVVGDLVALVGSTTKKGDNQAPLHTRHHLRSTGKSEPQVTHPGHEVSAYKNTLAHTEAGNQAEKTISLDSDEKRNDFDDFNV